MRSPNGPAPPPPPLEWYRVCNLTDRERKICELIVEGLMAKQVAFVLDIAEATVRTHMGNIFRKSNVHSRSQLIRRLWAAGMPPPSANEPVEALARSVEASSATDVTSARRCSSPR